MSGFPNARLPSSFQQAKAFGAFAVLVAGHLPFLTAHAQEPPMPKSNSPVVVLTKIATPWYAPRFIVVRKFRETLADYDRLPGLDFKYYTISSGDNKFGGLYLWKDRASAKAWFSDAWSANVLKTRGAPAEVHYFEAPVLLDNVPAGSPTPGEDGMATASIVSIKTPPGVTHDQLIEGFKKAVPDYQKVPGLLRKYFTISDDGRFGGVYLWADRASADRFFNMAWRERVARTYGTDGIIEFFDAPVVLASKLQRPAEIAERLVGSNAAR
jgi:hypothetical protein